MAVRGMVFDADPARPWLAERSLRSLRLAGLVEVSACVSLDVIELTSHTPSLLLLRAGAWLQETEPFSPPPASATASPLIALGHTHGENHGAAWAAARLESGGDFSQSTALPPLVSAWIDAAAWQGEASLPLTLGAFWSERVAKSRARPWRVIHWRPLDAEHDESLRVLQVVTSLQHGGAEQVTWDLHDLLPRFGLWSGVVTLGRPLRRSLPPPANWVDLAPWDREQRAELLKKLVDRFGIDLLHGHLLDGEDVRRFSSWGIPLTLTVHNVRASWPQGLEHLGAEQVATLFACAQVVERELLQAGLPMPVRTVWNGVRVNAPAQRDEAISRPLTLLCIANPRFQKRLHLLPAILAEMQRRRAQRNPAQEVRLIIAGEVSPRSTEALECQEATLAEARRLGLEAAMDWTHGDIPVAEALARSDVLISTSAHEGLSLAQLEGLAARLPLVVTDVGGAAEVAWGRFDVTLVPPDATQEVFASAIETALGKHAASAPWQSMPSFTRETMVGRYAWLYESLWMKRGECFWWITNNLGTGGAQSSLRRLVKRLHAQGHSVRVAVLQEYAEHPTHGRSDLEAAGIPVTVLPPAGSVDSAETVALLLRALRTHAPRAVIFWNVIPVYKILLVDALGRIPVWDVSPGEMYFASLERYFANPRPGLPYRSSAEYGRRLAGVVVKYQGEAAQAEKTLGARVQVIPNGVVIPPWSSRCERRATLVLGTAARLHPQKRLEDLLDAFRLALPEMPPCVLKVAGEVDEGDAAYGENLRNRASGLPVEWVGERRNMGAFHRELDVFVMISEPAGCPNASLEALAAGLPVIATDVGGAREQIRDGVDGWIVPPRDAAALAQALIDWARQPERSVEMGAAARQRISDEFSLERMTQRYFELFTRPSP